MDRLLAIAAAVSLPGFAGCALQVPKRTSPSMPDMFTGQAADARGTWPSKDWYQAFASPELDSLVAQAARNTGHSTNGSAHVDVLVEFALPALARHYVRVPVTSSVVR